MDMGGASTQISFEIPEEYPVAESEEEVYKGVRCVACETSGIYWCVLMKLWFGFSQD